MSRVAWFRSFLHRIASTRAVSQEDEQVICEMSSLSADTSLRQPEPIPRGPPPRDEDDFWQNHVTVYRSSEEGLEALGMRELPTGGPEIDGGAFASVRLAYRVQERAVPLQRRHLAIAKLQLTGYFLPAWKESVILKGVSHPHIVRFYGMFGVDPPPSARDRHGYPMPQVIWLLLEYANAGSRRRQA